MESTDSARDASLDAARGVLMILGIVVHTSNIYALDSRWIVADTQRSELFDLIGQSIHVFRMPAFFWISGFFAALTFERMGSSGLLRRRLIRIVVPLVATWITFNVAQEVLLATHARQDPVSAVLDGVPVGHLWFLVNLSVYIGLAALALPWLSRWGSRLRNPWADSTLGQLAALALLSYATLLAVRATGLAYDRILQVTNLYELALYAPYFAVGVLMYRRPDVRATFLRAPAWILLVAVPLALLAKVEPGDTRLVRESALLVHALATWMCVAGVLNFFRWLFSEETKVTRFLSEASYSVYLFHHLLVALLGLALLGLDIPAAAKFALICVGVAVSTSVAHVALVRPLRPMRFLFNGKWQEHEPGGLGAWELRATASR